MRVQATVLAATVTLALCACNAVGYYFQAIDGHLDVMRRTVSIEEVMQQRGATDALSQRLASARAIRDFASRELALPENGSFRSYADLKRPYVLWNVFATPELSIRPEESCFPFAGCVAYRGFYAEADARSFARELEAGGLDTYISGVPAYSTLGWFDDPLLSTFINYPDMELARLIFHELAHQVVYVRNDTQFNESFAVAVEQEGVRRWLASRGEASAVEEIQRWALARSRQREFLALLIRHRGLLAEIYAGDASDAEKRIAKFRQLQRLADDYSNVKQSWDGFSGFDRFFVEGANNALLASIAVYSNFVPGFVALIEKHHGNMSAFYAEVRSLSRQDKNARTQALQAREP